MGFDDGNEGGRAEMRMRVEEEAIYNTAVYDDDADLPPTLNIRARDFVFSAPDPPTISAGIVLGVVSLHRNAHTGTCLTP